MIFRSSTLVKLLLCSALVNISSFSVIYAAECQNPNGHCVQIPGDSSAPLPPSRSTGEGEEDNTVNDSKSDNAGVEYDAEKAAEEFRRRNVETLDGMNRRMFFPKYNNQQSGKDVCYTEDQRPGKPIRVLDQPATGEAANYNLKTRFSTYCQPNDTKTLTPTNPKETPKGPTIEEMLQEVEDQFANTNIQAPVLKQSYNLGTGLGENNPNVYKNQAVNFYVDDGGPYRLEADMLAGHIEIELMPSSYVIEYGNGDTDTNYTAGKPVTTYPRERPRQTATSYAYQRSGNFHAYATVHYTARFRVDGGPWQMMMVTPQATSDPLLIRVWWVDVGRVGGTCEDDDTRWGCKNDPTMGKKDNPNPRLRKADVRTGQRWHLNDSGDGDTEYSLHRDWPDM